MSFSKASDHFVVEETQVFAYRIPTEEPESDGTFKWNSTTLVLVRLKTQEQEALGYTYANTATALLIKDELLPLIKGENPLDHTLLWEKMVHQIRNLGRPGICSMAIAAIDNALWDLRAKIYQLPLCRFIGQCQKSVESYASGGFTSYSPDELQDKFKSQKAEGFSKFKMKIGRNKKEDLKRIEAARKAIGEAQLFVDANGAYHPAQALHMAKDFASFDIRWYEEPVTSDDLAGLKFIRNQSLAGLQVTAGEYGYDLTYFQRMLEKQAVDVLQADATRCGGITTLLKVNTLCEAYHIPLSTHCAPSLHLHPALCMNKLLHIEYFHDHIRIEQALFDGAPVAEKGIIKPDLSRPGLGLEFKFQDARKYQLKI